MLIRLFLACLGLALVSCSSNQGANNQKGQGEVNLYSQRHYDVDRLVYDKFEKETGIKVNVISASADELIAKLTVEAELTPCDLFLAVDAANLFKAKSLGLLQAVQSETLSQSIQPQYRDPEGFWFGQTMRARVIAVAKGLERELDSLTYLDLAHPNFKGKIVMRSSGSSYNQALLAGLIAHHGEDSARQWAKAVVANFARQPQGNDRDQIKDIAAGVGQITLVNTYYLGKMQKSNEQVEKDALNKVVIIFPNQFSYGTHVNVSGAGVSKYAKNKLNAIKLLEFLARSDIQQEFAANNEEYPVGYTENFQGVLADLGPFKKDTLALELLGKFQNSAIKIFDEVGWK